MYAHDTISNELLRIEPLAIWSKQFYNDDDSAKLFKA